MIVRGARKLVFCAALIVILVSSLPFITAITASIGNSRMILRLDVGESIEKSILVKNVNDVPVTIELFVAGDLNNTLKLREQNFTLQPGDEKKAYFTLKAEKAGTTETKINIKFAPEDGASVGLSATVIVIAGGENVTENDEENIEDKEGNTNTTGMFIRDGLRKFSISPIILLSLSTLVLVIILIVLVIYAKRRNEKKGFMPVTTDSIKSKKSVQRNA